MKEFLTYYGLQGLTWIALVGVTVGAGIYNVTNPTHATYKADMTRATTYTGKGQFRCQVGC